MIGHSSNKPCAVCGKHNNNSVEPRFLYTVCEEHEKLSPVEISRLANDPFYRREVLGDDRSR